MILGKISSLLSGDKVVIIEEGNYFFLGTNNLAERYVGLSPGFFILCPLHTHSPPALPEVTKPQDPLKPSSAEPPWGVINTQVRLQAVPVAHLDLPGLVAPVNHPIRASILVRHRLGCISITSGASHR